MNRQLHTRQNGFSLVELMVALTISLILLAGILQILLGNRQSMDVQRAEADLQDNARLARFATERVIARAGYRVDPDKTTERLFPGTEGKDDAPDFPTGAVVSGDNKTITVRFWVNDDFRGCDSSTPETNKPASFRIEVKDGALRCGLIAPDHNPQPLTPDNSVAVFLIQYGLDTTGDHAVNTYAKTPEGGIVRSVRLQILLKSDVNVLPMPEQRHYALADGSIYTTPDNRLAYQMVDQTIALRNALP